MDDIIIIIHPIGNVRYETTNITFSVEIQTPISFTPQYQWYKDNVIIENETDSILILSNLEMEDDGEYYCEITSPFESINSDIARLIIIEYPIIIPEYEKLINPICVFHPIGRGEYYNSYSINISKYKNSYNLLEYILDIYQVQKDKTNQIIESFRVSFNPKNKDESGNSIFIEDVLNNNSNILRCTVTRNNNEYSEGFKSLFESYSSNKGNIEITNNYISDDKQDFTNWISSDSTSTSSIIDIETPYTVIFSSDIDGVIKKIRWDSGEVLWTYSGSPPAMDFKVKENYIYTYTSLKEIEIISKTGNYIQTISNGEIRNYNIDSNGYIWVVIYIGGQYKLQKYNDIGQLIFSVDLPDNYHSNLTYENSDSTGQWVECIDANRINDTKFLRFSSDGIILVETDFNSTSFIQCADNDGNAYIKTYIDAVGYFIKLAPDGSIIYNFVFDLNFYNGVFQVDDEIWGFTSQWFIHRLQKDTGQPDIILSHNNEEAWFVPVIDSEGNLYYLSYESTTIFKSSNDGTLIWAYDFEKSDCYFNYYNIGKDDYFYLYFEDGVVFKINPDGISHESLSVSNVSIYGIDSDIEYEISQEEDIINNTVSNYCIIVKDRDSNIIYGWIGDLIDEETITIYDNKNMGVGNVGWLGDIDDFDFDSFNFIYEIRKNYIPIEELFNQPIPLKKGSDGSLINRGEVNPEIATNILQRGYEGLLYSRKFNNQIVDDITNLDTTYFSMIFDGGYPSDVKQKISELARTRQDSIAILDNGDSFNIYEAIVSRDLDHKFTDYYTAIYEQYNKVYDEFTGKDIWVSPIYHMASLFPRNDRVNEVWNGVSGYDFVLSNIKELRYIPDSGEKDELYLNQLNYFSRFNVGIVPWGQLTSQQEATALSDINVVRLVLYCKVALERYCRNFIFKENNLFIWDRVFKDVTDFLDEIRSNRGLYSFNVEVGATEYEIKQKKFHVNVILNPTRVAEKIDLNFFVG